METKKRRFVLTAVRRDTILATGVVLAIFLCGVVVKDNLYQMYMMLFFALAALVVSLLYFFSNRPLPRRELRSELLLDSLIVAAALNFLYKILYVY